MPATVGLGHQLSTGNDPSPCGSRNCWLWAVGHDSLQDEARLWLDRSFPSRAEVPHGIGIELMRMRVTPPADLVDCGLKGDVNEMQVAGCTESVGARSRFRTSLTTPQIPVQHYGRPGVQNLGC